MLYFILFYKRDSEYNTIYEPLLDKSIVYKVFAEKIYNIIYFYFEGNDYSQNQ